MINPRTRSCLAVMLAAVLSIAMAAQATTVRDLYMGQVAVEDRSQSELSQAASDALSQVLVKVSGSTEVLSLPEVLSALPEAMSQVQQFSYAISGNEEQPLAARFEFDRRWVSQLLRQAGAPLWTANRPEVLLWLVQDGPEGRQFVNVETAPELVAALEAGFARRGVPLRFPLLDLTDAAALSAEQAWNLNATVLQQASSRYRVNEVLAGRVTALGSGDWLGDWLYLFADGRLERSVEPQSIDSFLAQGVDMVAENMADRYAVSAASESTGGVSMTVSNVMHYADYAAIVSWLEGLEPIEQASIEEISGDRLLLRLQARADASALKAIIELNQALVPLAHSTVSPSSELNYQWQN